MVLRLYDSMATSQFTMRPNYPNNKWSLISFPVSVNAILSTLSIQFSTIFYISAGKEISSGNSIQWHEKLIRFAISITMVGVYNNLLGCTKTLYCKISLSLWLDASKSILIEKSVWTWKTLNKISIIINFSYFRKEEKMKFVKKLMWKNRIKAINKNFYK